MIQIRQNVFETNSSSTHSLVISTEDEFSRFSKGELVYCQYNNGPFKSGKFYSKSEVDAYAEEHEDEFDEYDFQTCDDIFENEYLEVFEEHFTTPHGDQMVAFGNFGYDG